MLCGVRSVNPSKVGSFIHKKNIGKKMELPAKIALGTLGALGIANSVKASNSAKNEHTDRYCGSDFACSVLY